MSQPLRLVSDDVLDLEAQNARVEAAHDFARELVVRALAGWTKVPAKAQERFLAAWGYGDLLTAALAHQVTADDIRAAVEANRRHR